MRYWLDANIFITAKNSLYAFEINSSLWNWIDTQLSARTVVAPERVFKEIMDYKKDDLLKQWAFPRKDMGLCVEPSKKVSHCVSRIADHLYTAEKIKRGKTVPRYKHAQISFFSQGADAFVIAHAMEDGGTVVSFESDVKPESEKIRIPDICHHFGVYCIDLKKLLFNMGARL